LRFYYGFCLLMLSSIYCIYELTNVSNVRTVSRLNSHIYSLYAECQAALIDYINC